MAMCGDFPSTPLASFGYRLPEWRLYAQYFQRDLKLYFLEEYHMDAIISIEALLTEAIERLSGYM